MARLFPLLPPRACLPFRRYPVESVEMMRCIIDEAESWKGSNPELVLPDAAEPSATSEMEGIASATVHAAHSLSEFFIPYCTRFAVHFASSGTRRSGCAMSFSEARPVSQKLMKTCRFVLRTVVATYFAAFFRSAMAPGAPYSSLLPHAPSRVASRLVNRSACVLVVASSPVEAKLIVVVTKKGRMARLVAKFRPNVPVSDLI